MKSLLMLLKQHPEIGVVTSITSALLDAADVFQALGMILGLMIGVLTLSIKMFELVAIMRKKKD